MKGFSQSRVKTQKKSHRKNREKECIVATRCIALVVSLKNTFVRNFQKNPARKKEYSDVFRTSYGLQDHRV
jgi:hypothetical protein